MCRFSSLLVAVVIAAFLIAAAYAPDDMAGVAPEEPPAATVQVPDSSLGGSPTSGRLPMTGDG